MSLKKHKPFKLEDLKPCPFCGGDAYYSDDFSKPYFFHKDMIYRHVVTCMTCGATIERFTNGHKTMREAYDMMAGLWNRRTGVNDGEQTQDNECDNAGCDEG